MSVDFDAIPQPAGAEDHVQSDDQYNNQAVDQNFDMGCLRITNSELDPELVMAATIFVEELILRAQLQVDEKFAACRSEDDEDYENMVRSQDDEQLWILFDVASGTKMRKLVEQEKLIFASRFSFQLQLSTCSTLNMVQFDQSEQLSCCQCHQALEAKSCEIELRLREKEESHGTKIKFCFLYLFDPLQQWINTIIAALSPTTAAKSQVAQSQRQCLGLGRQQQPQVHQRRDKSSLSKCLSSLPVLLWQDAMSLISSFVFWPIRRKKTDIISIKPSFPTKKGPFFGLTF